MKSLLAFFLFIITSSAFANTWTYQVTVNSNQGSEKKLDSGKSSFDAGPYYCEVTPVSVANLTEYRTLTCTAGSGTVSTGGLCTKKGAKFASVQYAILTLTGAKNIVNITVACKFN